MSKDTDEMGLFRCSFCTKSQHEVRKIIAGPTVNICDECVLLCVEILIVPAAIKFPDPKNQGGVAA